MEQNTKCSTEVSKCVFYFYKSENAAIYYTDIAELYTRVDNRKGAGLRQATRENADAAFVGECGACLII